MMARIRAIKPEITMDEELAELGFAARWFFVNLWCHADREGKCEDRPKMLQAKILPWDNKVDANELLNELHPKFVLRYEVDGKKYLLVRSFTKHQRPKPEEADSVIPNPPEGILKVSQELPKGNCKVSPKRIGNREVGIGNGKGNGISADETALESTSVQVKEKPAFKQFMDWFLATYYSLEPGNQDPSKKAAVSAAYKQWGSAASKILAFASGDPERAKRGTNSIVDRMNKHGLECNLATVARHFLDWNVSPEAYERETKTGR